MKIWFLKFQKPNPLWKSGFSNFGNQIRYDNLVSEISETKSVMRIWFLKFQKPNSVQNLITTFSNTKRHVKIILSIKFRNQMTEHERVETVLRHHPAGNCRQSVTIQTSWMPPWDMPVQTDLSTLAGLLNRPAFLTCLLGRATSSACKTKINRNMPGLHHLAASKNQVKILMSPLQLGLDPHMQNIWFQHTT